MIDNLSLTAPKHFFNFKNARSINPKFQSTRDAVRNIPRFGALKTYAANSPSPTPEGLLVEKEATNMMRYYDKLSYPLINGMTLVPVVDTSTPAGKYNRANQTITAGSCGHYEMIRSTTPNTQYCLSVYVKKGSARYGMLYFGGNTHQVYSLEGMIDFETGELILLQSNVRINNPDRFGAIYVGNGWWRIWLNTITTSVASPNIRATVAFRNMDPSTGPIAPVPPGNDIGFWGGVQVEVGPTPTSLIMTNGSAASRPKDELVLDIPEINRYTVAITYLSKNAKSIMPLNLLKDTQQVCTFFCAGDDAIAVDRLLLGTDEWVGDVVHHSGEKYITLIVSIDNDVVRFYNSEDPNSYRQKTTTKQTAINKLSIGTTQGWANSCYDGVIERIVIYDKLFSEQEMKALAELYTA